MTDSRQRRADTLRQAARRKSEAKTKAAEAAVRALVKRGEPITFQSVHGNADLRGRIERLRSRSRPKPPPPEGSGSDNTLIQALTSQITHLKNSAATKARPFGPRLSRPTERTWNSAANSPASAGTCSPQRRVNVTSIATTT